MFPNGIQRNRILIKFTQLLLLNISPDYSARISLDETKSRFEKVFFGDGKAEDYEDIVSSFDYESDTAGLRSSKPKSD